MVDISDWDVIVVDDEPDNIGVVQLVLQFHGSTVRTALSGPECLALLEERIPTLVLVDIQMPEMDGYKLLRAVRQRVDWESIPVIAITAHARQEDRDQIMAAGFDGYIGKPINVMTLVDEIIQIVQA